MTTLDAAWSTWWQVRAPSACTLSWAIFGAAPSRAPNVHALVLPLKVIVTCCPAQAFHLSADVCTNALAFSADGKAATDSNIRWAGSSPAVCTAWPLTSVEPLGWYTASSIGSYAPRQSKLDSVPLGVRSCPVLSAATKFGSATMVPISAAPSRYESSFVAFAGLAGLAGPAGITPLALGAGLDLPPCVTSTTSTAIAAMTATAAAPMMINRVLDPPPAALPRTAAVDGGRAGAGLLTG